MYNLKWSFSNSKLAKTNTISFNIPAFRSESGFKTCPQAGACAALCYARQGAYNWPKSKAVREYNLFMSKIPTFMGAAIEDLRKIKQTSIRIHDSGDFYSQDYLEAWALIAKECPDKQFYAYTKSLDLDFSVLPSNFKITQSKGGLLDHLIDEKKSHAKAFGNRESLLAAGYVDGSETDLAAQQNETRIGLVYHGQKKPIDDNGFLV